MNQQIASPGIGMMPQPMLPSQQPPTPTAAHVPLQQQQQPFDLNLLQFDGLHDPVAKSKDLFNQLKNCLNVQLNHFQLKN